MSALDDLCKKHKNDKEAIKELADLRKRAEDHECPHCGRLLKFSDGFWWAWQRSEQERAEAVKKAVDFLERRMTCNTSG
jgi:hypothetical protein